MSIGYVDVAGIKKLLCHGSVIRADKVISWFP